MGTGTQACPVTAPARASTSGTVCGAATGECAAVVAGRSDEARRILAMVQTQMVLRPVTPDQPMAEGGNPSATDVGAAIRWLDMGVSGQAMQAISRAINHANAAELPGQFPGYFPNGSTQ